MATQKDLIQRETEVTDKISTQVRTIAAGLIIFTWGIFNSSEGTLASGMRRMLIPLLLIVDVLCILALSADFLQYIFAKITVDKAFNNIVNDGYAYDDEWTCYRAQNWAFWSKIVLSGLAILMTFTLTAYALAKWH
jgi:hypothetical protein